MSDLLVRLYDLPPLAPLVAVLDKHGIAIRRALAGERPQVTDFAREHGSEGWAAECEAAFARMPLACFVAAERRAEDDRRQVASGERYVDRASPVTRRPAATTSGPSWSTSSTAGRGVGKALLLAALHAMRAEGYAYGIIGWASSIDFYRKVVGATVIEGSKVGIYPAPLAAPPPRGR